MILCFFVQLHFLVFFEHKPTEILTKVTRILPVRTSSLNRGKLARGNSGGRILSRIWLSLHTFSE